MKTTTTTASIATTTVGIIVLAACAAAPLVEGFAGGGRWHKTNKKNAAHSNKRRSIAVVAPPLYMSEIVGDPSSFVSSRFYNGVNYNYNYNNNTDFATVEMTSATLSDNNIDLFTSPAPVDMFLDNSLVLEQQRVVVNNVVARQPSMTAMMWGRFICLTAAAIYGTNFATVKMLDQVMPLAVSAVLRFGLAAIVVAAIVVGQEKVRSEKQDNHQHHNSNLYSASTEVAAATAAEEEGQRWSAMMLGAEVGAWYAAGYLCQAIGLHMVDASKSAFFNALAVIVVPLLDVAFKKAKLGARGLGSIAMALSGVALLQLGPSLTTTTTTTTNLLAAGDLFCFAQALFFGIGYWRLEKAASDFPNQAGRITMGQLMGVAAGSLLYCATTTGLPSFDLVTMWLSNPFVRQALIWTGLFSTALALYLETVALKTISATELTILMTSVSLWGSAFAYVTIGEVLEPIGMLGGLLILSGCLLSALKPQEKNVVERQENAILAP